MEIIDNIFEKARNGIYEIPVNLPENISHEVIEKNLLYMELKELLKTNDNTARIEEIKQILYPPEEEEDVEN